MNMKCDFDLDAFLHVYFYILETTLNASDNNGLNNVKFQSEEANTDEYLKKFFKEFIEENNSIENTVIEEFIYYDGVSHHNMKTADLLSFQIAKVFLPDDISSKHKKIILADKSSVYTNPDLYLEIKKEKHVYYRSVELKSTKKDKIPGSSVQQISPFEWVIFIQRNKFKILVSTGAYINCITDKLPFPDRSPRPQIGFKTLQRWNDSNRKLESSKLIVKNELIESRKKIDLLSDWQGVLAKEWLDIILEQEDKTTEKWFNNAIRKFSILLINYIDTLNIEEQVKLIEHIRSKIKK